MKIETRYSIGDCVWGVFITNPNFCKCKTCQCAKKPSQIEVLRARIVSVKVNEHFGLVYKLQAAVHMQSRYLPYIPEDQTFLTQEEGEARADELAKTLHYATFR